MKSVVAVHGRSPWVLGSAGAAKPFAAMGSSWGRRGCAVKGGSEGAGAARRRSRGAPAKARQAGETGAQGVRIAQHCRRERGRPIGLRVNPNSAAQQQKSAAPAMYGAAPQGLNAASIRRWHHRLQLFDHAKLDKDTRLLGRDRNVEHPGEGIPLQMRQPPGAVHLIRLHQA